MIAPVSSALVWAGVLAQTVSAGVIAQRRPDIANASPELLHKIRTRLVHARQTDERVFEDSTVLDRTFNDAVLFEFVQPTNLLDPTVPGNENASAIGTAGVKVTCTDCYIAGTAFAKLTVGENDFSFSDTLDSVGDIIDNAIDGLGDWFGEIDFFDFEIDIPPPPNFDVDIDIPILPETILEFGFDGLELFAGLTTTFTAGSTYKLKLFQTGLGADLGEDLFLGLVFSVDLIISAQGELNLEHGFHIKLNDGILMKIAMFSDEASELAFNGGYFENLPVEIVSAGAVFRAVVQLSLRAGFTVNVDLIPGDFDIGFLDNLKGGAGLETRVFANVVDLKTNISALQEEECNLRVQQSFQFDVGAAAGAFIAIGSKTWGPQPKTEIPIFPVTFIDECILPATPTADPTIEEGLETTTISSEITHTAIHCAQLGDINCPASQEWAIEFIVTETLVTGVPPGAEATFPATVTEGPVLVRSEFGPNAVALPTTFGKPEPAVPSEAPLPELLPEAPVVEEPVVEEPPAEEPAPEEPMVEEPVVEEPAPEEPVVEEPVPEEPAPEMPAPEMPAPEMPTPEEPAPEMPAPEMPEVPEVTYPEMPAPEQPMPSEPTPEMPAPVIPLPEEIPVGGGNSTYAWPSKRGTRRAAKYH